MIRAGAAGAAVAALWASLPPARGAAGLAEALEAMLAGRAGVESARLRLDLPQQFDYGSTVPLAFKVDAPMSGASHVRRVSVFAAGNPFPEVATFHFTPESGRASAATRIRLNEGDREVIAVAELSDGSAWLARRRIEVAVGGCGVEIGAPPRPAIARHEPRLVVPAQAARGEIVEIKTMISHWMETGLRIDTAGRPIPRRIIHRMVCSRGGAMIFAADLTPAIAPNAYLSFPMVARESAVLSFEWHEDGGAVYRGSHSLTVT